jgi:hypothetical protein
MARLDKNGREDARIRRLAGGVKVGRKHPPRLPHEFWVESFETNR